MTALLIPPALVLLLAAAATPPTPGRAVEAVIDQDVEAAMAADGVTPAPQTDDHTLIRRLTLDLVGRIPTLGEVEAYTRSTDPDKRGRLVDRLLASRGFARQQADRFDAALNVRPGAGGKAGSLRDYLTAAVAENRPWDRVFRELLLPDEADPRQRGAAEFLRPRLSDLDRLTADVSVAFFGVNVSCAQCHDHPLVPDWKQDHFYGMKAFLARTFDNGGFLAERGGGAVRFKPNKGPERAARMMFLTGARVDHPSDREPTAAEAKAEKQAFDKAKAAKQPPPPPAFSARARLVELALAPGGSDFFAKAVVNRLWHRFLGYGLVTPLDQMHSENPPSHPELLVWLADDLRGHGYDLRRLVRGIVMSRAYSRSSQYPSEAHPEPRYFAVARLKPLTPRQLATSLRLAAADPRSFDGPDPKAFEKKVEEIESAARGFAALLPEPNDNFQVGVGESLLFSNGDRVAKEVLADGGGTLLGRVKGIDDPKAAVGLLVRTALGRPATANEEKTLTEYVARRADRRGDADRQVLWALMTCPEFRFNH